MRRSIFKWAIGIVLCIMLALSSVMMSFAYWEGDCCWSYDGNGGNVLAKWDKCEGANGYILTVYKGSTVVYGPESLGGKSKDVTSTIINKGSGTYTFVIVAYAKESDGSYRELDSLTSDDLELSSSDVSSMKNRRKEVKAAEGATDGWHSYPNNTWTYGKGNGTLAKNEWLQINGKWYHFDNKGYMNKGWNQINGNYYYFDEKNGDLWVNTTTPDGYQVNQDGVRIDASGTPMTGTPVNGKVTVTIQEQGDDGTVKKATVTGVSNANLVDWKFDTPYEQWSVGTPVTLYVRVTSSNGFPFDSKSTFSCSNATYKTFYGSNPTTIEFTYYPKMKLSKPTNLTIDSANVVKWTAVPYAGSYNVKVYDNNTSVGTVTVDTNSADIGSYMDGNNSISVGVVAAHNKPKKTSSIGRYFSNSDEAKLEHVSEIIENNATAEGRFTTSDGNLYYKDENGDKVKGWKQIQGYWYYFDNLGRAAGPGWFQNKDGNWYYFNNEHKMMTGNINDGKGDYFMNDGSNPNFPVGAWVH